MVYKQKLIVNTSSWSVGLPIFYILYQSLNFLKGQYLPNCKQSVDDRMGKFNPVDRAQIASRSLSVLDVIH